MRSSVVSAFPDLPRTDPRRTVAAWRRPVSLPIVTGLIGACDGASVLLAGVAAAGFAGVRGSAGDDFCGAVAILGMVLMLNVLQFAGAYRSERVAGSGAAAATAAIGWMVAAALVGGLAALVRPPIEGFAAWFGAWAVMALVALAAERQGWALMLRRWRKEARLGPRIAVIGAGPLGERVVRHLEGVARVAAIYDDRRTGAARWCAGRRVAGPVDDLVEDIRRGGIDEVVIALPGADEQRVAAAIGKLAASPIALRQCVETLSFGTRPFTVVRRGGLNLIGRAEAPLRDWWGLGKAIEDRVIAAIALALLGPVMVVIALLVKRDSPGPVLFRQLRHGLNDRLIEVLKFRTMYQDDCDPNAERLTRRHDPRVTRIGAVLRRTMLDELPQLINVLKGEMSIVGPRPHALRAKAGGLLYGDAVPDYHARHRMKPGMTGWAQVNGWRGTTDTVEQIENRVACDLFYIDNWSVAFDVAIILRTLLLPLQGLRRT
jgi:Undecaprenyl-phosphate glucose phosphotransferase